MLLGHATPFRQLLWRCLALLVSVLALAWVLYLLAPVWPEFSAHRHDIRATWLFMGIVPALLSSYLAFSVFTTLVEHLQIARFSHRELAHLYFTGQLLKHLPGRIWGIGYQWVAAPDKGLTNWVVVNMAHLFFATYFAVGSAVLVIGWQHANWTGALVATSVIVGYVVIWLVTAFAAKFEFPRWAPQRLGNLRRSAVELFRKTRGTGQVAIFAGFVISAALNYLAWYFYGKSYPALGAWGGLRLCAYYMIAWLLGYFSFLTPSGIGVRELAFTWLAKDFPGDSIAYMALVGRASLLAVDLLLGLAYSPFSPRKR